MYPRTMIFYLLLVALSFSAIENLDLTSTLDASGSANLVVKAEFSDSAGKPIFMNLSAPVDDLTVKDRSGLVLDHDIQEADGSTAIYVTVPYDYLQFEIASDSFTTKSGPSWDYYLSLSASENITALSAMLSLPKGAVLKSTNGAVQADEALTVSWSANDIDTFHKATMRAGYELTAIEEDLDVSVILAAIIVLSISGIIYYFKFRKPEKAHEPEKTDKLESNSLFKTLDENDKEIIREVYRQGGKTTQSHLYLHTHIPKATLSRRLHSLENRGILKKSQKGNRNLITLTDVFEK